MLRALVLVLLLANAAFFAWAQGYLQPWGLAPVQQSEPHRRDQQIRPAALRVLRGDEVAAETAMPGASAAARDPAADPPRKTQQTETSR